MPDFQMHTQTREPSTGRRQAPAYLLLLLVALTSPSLAIKPQPVSWISLETQGQSTQATASVGTVPVIAELTVQDCNVQGVALSVGGESISLPSIALLSDGCPRPSKMVLLQSSCCFAVVPSAKPEDEMIYLDLVVPLEEQLAHSPSARTIKFSFTYRPGALRVLWPVEPP